MRKNIPGVKGQVLKAIQSGYCNTSLDVSDEIGVPVNQCSSYIHALKRQGYVKFTGRTMPNKSANGKGRKLHVFEVTA